jgi:hypothetical protein
MTILYGHPKRMLLATGIVGVGVGLAITNGIVIVGGLALLITLFIYGVANTCG